MEETNAPQTTPPAAQPPATQTPTAPPPPPPAAPEPEKPKRKSLLAPLIGILILILVGAGGWYTYMNRPLPVPEYEPVEQPEPVTVPLFLEITSPVGEVVAVNGEILVSGRTLPGTTVMIFTDTDETSLESDIEGNFESTVVVGTAGGTVQITAYGESGEEMTETLSIIASE